MEDGEMPSALMPHTLGHTDREPVIEREPSLQEGQGQGPAQGTGGED